MMRTLILSVFLLSFGASAQDKLTPAEGKLMFKEGLRHWQNRDVKENLEEAVMKFDLALTASPNDLEVLTYLVRGNFLLGDVFAEQDGQKMTFLERAKDYGLVGLRTNEKFKKAEKKKDLQEAVKELTDRETEILYWTAASLGKWSKANGIFSSMKYKNDILAMIKRVEELNPKFFYGAVPRYWGGFYAIAPGIAGGDMKKSKKKFEESMKEAPECLTTQVLYAELYLAKEGEKKEFKKVLEAVLKAPAGPEEIQPENRMEKRKAEKLLENIEKIF